MMKWQILRGQRLRTQCIEQSKAQAKVKRQREEQEKRGLVIGGVWVHEDEFQGSSKKQHVE
ncbi:hypothetical protein, partial [Salmonella sp. SAL4457]|uniref:hypothetical protein n=1 Tax=Salmonella sp. SAL4457 TaxID=3159912 RepID=UPI003978CE59